MQVLQYLCRYFALVQIWSGVRLWKKENHGWRLNSICTLKCWLGAEVVGSIVGGWEERPCGSNVTARTTNLGLLSG